MDKQSKIYVAGHLGLVGSSILKKLQLNGYSNFILKTFNELDLTKQNQVEIFFQSEKPEYIFLAAAKVGGIMANNTLRAQFIYENIMIQNNVIHSSWNYGVKKLLFLGSTCIYPKNAPQPISEEMLLTSPLEYTNEPYAIAKIAGLKMCESYNLQYGTNFLSVMPTNLYGPNDNFDLEDSHVLPALIRKIFLGKCLERNDWVSILQDIKKRPIKGISIKVTREEILTRLSEFGIKLNPDHVSVQIWGSGEPLREFMWSEDLADACVYIMENIDFKDMSKDNEIRNTHINIGTGKEISIKNLAELIKKKVGFNGMLFYNVSKPDGTLRKLTNSSRIHSLGWYHKVDIEEGIEKLYSWYTSSLNS
jgi:GDP-L-fucose synthase